ncbi:MAG TPA: hypothetical protein EYP14_03590, partial [Planctomycetaceae bacterium]|nr:hypothetical protein [Planctomycetaceae bacterium]
MSQKAAKGGSSPPTQDPLWRTIAGYLNFSSGQPDTTFQKSLNELWASSAPENPWAEFPKRLRDCLDRLRRESSAFGDCSQALAVLDLTFEELYPAYRRFHADLLFHLTDADFQQPFFLGRLFEAVLSQGAPWDEVDRIVHGALDHLNDFVGYRPLAVLEDGRKTQPYPHERFRPIPLYLRGAGVAFGPYEPIVSGALEMIQRVPADMLATTYFDFDRLDELAVDVRAYDHEHPANKRTNYMFGEWDPHLIDSKGFYRRFVVRKIILDALVQWVERYSRETSREEALFDASAVLCGTMLMASSISGAGPSTHDSSVTLTSLLPRVAQQRDAYYDWLMEQAHGARAERLQREARKTRQPFGHVRQALNLHLAHHGARQVQHRYLAHLYARMGHAPASREQAAAIPSLAARFQSEMQWRITTAHWHLSRSNLPQAAQLLEELDDLFQRGVQCGALLDPWNILGFQGNFPLFSSREDSIPDPRVEILLSLVEGIFGVYAHTLAEAAVQGDRALSERVAQAFQRFAEQWDRYATTAVEDLPHISGDENWKSARAVAKALSDWRAAGESAGDITFWREHVSEFESSRSYAQVVHTLLRKNDTVAAMGLLMHWLSQADEVGVESGPHSIFSLLLAWLKNVLTPLRASNQSPQPPDPAPPAFGSNACVWDRVWKDVCRLFDYLEANAGDYWNVPTWEGIAGTTAGRSGTSAEQAPSELDEETPDTNGLLEDEESTDWGDPLYRAAYEGVVFRDSAWDGNVDEVLDSGPVGESSEIELIGRRLLPHLRFLVTLAAMWQETACALLP